MHALKNWNKPVKKTKKTIGGQSLMTHAFSLLGPVFVFGIAL